MTEIIFKTEYNIGPKPKVTPYPYGSTLVMFNVQKEIINATNEHIPEKIAQPIFHISSYAAPQTYHVILAMIIIIISKANKKVSPPYCFYTMI